MRAVVRLSLMAMMVVGFLAPTGSALAQEEGDWKSLDQEAKRQKIQETCQATAEKVAADNPKAKELFDKSYGWAAFDNTKVAFGISGGGGNGMAVNKMTGEKTYMKMGTGGIGLGIGVQSYQVFFLFENETTFNNFVNKGWQADASAQAAAGKAAAGAQTGFVNGVAIYQITDKGLIASADVSGTKYSKNDKLNK